MNKKLHPLFIISIVGILLYARTFSFEYTNFDDNTLILENQNYISHLSNISDAFKKTVFINGSDVFYRPMETVWFILNAQIGKENLFVYHFSSLLLHLLAAYLIFILLVRLNSATKTSLLLSLFFLVHPLFAQAVAWVPGVVDILVTIFSIGSFLFFRDFIESQQRKHYVLSIFFFALALYTKEIAVGLIAVCLYYLHFIRKEKFISYNKKIFLIGWFSVSALWFVMRHAALKGQPHKDFSGMISSMAENFPAIVQYIGKILLPFNLSVMPVMKDTSFLFGIFALVLFSVLFFLSKKKRKDWILFGIIWFVIFLLPTFIRTSEFRIQQFYEHRMYLPMVGILFFLSEMDWIKNFSFDKIQYKVSAIIFLLFFFGLTFQHEKTFSDTKNFLDNAVNNSPSSSLAHRNLGIYFQDKAAQDKNLLKNAAGEYLKALELNPHEKDLHNNLGVIYDTWGKKDSAEKEYLTEINLNPSNAQAFHNLGVICMGRNENEKAETYFKKAIDINANPATLEQLALLYKKTGKQQEFEKISGMLTRKPPTEVSQPMKISAEDAEKSLLEKFKKDSSDKQVLYNLGLLYYQTGRKSEAEKMWRKTVQADSTFIDAYNNLAIVLALQGKNSEAESTMKKVIHMKPDYVEGYFNLANFYSKNGNEKEAVKYVNELKKRGVGKERFRNITPELEKLFDRQQ
ncbi:MAG: tetratricopeptide repeat protein [Bacteroidetes bacterium]|nr:tetratricopeptide repeat protein [Bacteroidota bacterium]